MFSKSRLIYYTLLRSNTFHKSISYHVTKRISYKPPRNVFLGLSLFTWLGFKKEITPEDELINMIKHSILFIRKTDYQKAEQLLHVALRQAQQMHHKDGVTYIYDILANLALEREELDKAKNLFVTVSQRIMAEGAEQDDIRVIHISAKLARICHLQKEYANAQLGYDWCLQKLNQLFEKNPNEDIYKLIAITEDWYGRLFLDNNEWDKGLKYLLRALTKMKEINDLEEEHIVYQLNDIGTVYEQLDNIDESIQYFKKAIEMANNLPDKQHLGTMYVNMGRAYMRKNLFEEARKNCGYGWRLGALSNNNELKKEASACLEEVSKRL